MLLQGKLKPTCDHNFDFMTEEEQNNEDHRSALSKSTVTSFSKTHSLGNTAEKSASQSSEAVSLTHELICYFVTNSAIFKLKKNKGSNSYLFFLQDLEEGNDEFESIESEWKYHYKEFIDTPGFLLASHPLIIQENCAKRNQLAKLNKKLTLHLGEKRFLCCKKELIESMSIRFLKLCITEQDQTLDVELTFNRPLLNSFEHFEAIVFSRYVRQKEDKSEMISTNILKCHSQPLMTGIQITPGIDETKFIAKIPISEVHRTIYTFSTYTMTVTCGIKVFLSKKPGSYQTELDERAINLIRSSGQDKKLFNLGIIANHLQKMQETAASSQSKVVLLPFTEIPLSQFYFPNSLPN